MRSALPAFVRANAAILGLILAALALGSGVQDTIREHLIVFAASLILLEGCVIAGLIYIHHDQSTRRHFDEVAAEAGTVKALQVRFAMSTDFRPTDRVYREWFKPGLSVDDGEYCKLMDRGDFVRVVEAKHREGAQQSVVIVGYYSIWPLALSTFEAMADGRIRERQITSAMILSPSDPAARVLYVPEICASKRAWEFARGPLVFDLAHYIRHLLLQNSHLEYVAAWPYSDQGQHYVDKLRMRRVGRSRRQKFYWASRHAVLPVLQDRQQFKPKWSAPHFPPI